MSHIKVIIVGAGFAGLTAAIECKRKGHTPIVLESFPELKILGDIISFGPNAGRIFKRWDGVAEKLSPICIKTEGLRYKSYLGEDLFYQSWEPERKYGTAFSGHRGEIHEIVYNYAVGLGIEVRLGQKVTEYFETDTEAGVVANGERVLGDIVLAADGVRSTGRTLVLGYEDKPESSGYAIYRAWFDSKAIAENPRTKFMVENGDTHVAWLGPDIHFLAASLKDGKDFSWVCTHKVSPHPATSTSIASPNDHITEIDPHHPLTQSRSGLSQYLRRLANPRPNLRRPRNPLRLGPNRPRHRLLHPLPHRLETSPPLPPPNLAIPKSPHRPHRRRRPSFPPDLDPRRQSSNGGRCDRRRLPRACWEIGGEGSVALFREDTV